MKSGVLADDGLYFDGRDVQPIDTGAIRTIIDLLNLAEQYGCSQVWLLPESKLYERLKRNNKRLFKIEDLQGWDFAPKELKNMVTGWRGNKRRQLIFSGAVDAHWPLETITEPRALLRAIAWFVEHTGVYPSIPTRTARKIVEASITKPLIKCESDLTIFADHKAPELEYLRQPQVDEAGRKYAHGFDKNYMFLSACAINLGDGDYDARAGIPFDKHLPGIWQATIKGGRADVRALCELRGIEDIEEAGRFWYYTPTLELADDCGAEIIVEAAYVWRNGRRVLEKFYKTVRAGVLMRDELRGVEQIAAKSLKDVYAKFIGWLARNYGENGQAFWRPDWRSLIVDEAYQRLIRNVIKVSDATGMMPFGVHRDCLLYFSDEPDASRFPSPLAGAGAQYKHVFTASSDEAMKLINSEYSVSQLAGELKKRWKGGRAYGSKRSRKAS
jgi:hypothetical protein